MLDEEAVHLKTYKMEQNTILLICLGICLLILYKIYNRGRGRLPPGPPGWPLVGNTFDLGANPHQSLHKLSQKYGPIMSIQLGGENTLVLSSTQVVTEMFKKHDPVVSDRYLPEGVKVHQFDQKFMGAAPHGPFWKTMRRLYTTELFTNNRIKATEDIRTKSINNLIKWIWEDAQEKGSVQIAQFMQFMSFNTLGNAIFSKDIVDPKSKEGTKFFHAAMATFELMVKPNVADLFPLWLRWIVPQGRRKRINEGMWNALSSISALVGERIQDRKNGKTNNKKDFLDAMLDFEVNQKDGVPINVPDSLINMGIIGLLQAGTEATTMTMEWIITELLRNPRVMRKVQAEVDQVVGKKKNIEDEDTRNLPYLQAVVKETLRLHPTLPLLARRSNEDMEFMGYLIPKNTQIYVNAWAIARNPTFWDDPLSFKPERFLNSDVNYKGQHYQLLPFGAGRRICVGMPLAHNTVLLTMASLIRTFEWAPADGIEPEKVSIEENFGTALTKAVPLKVALKLRGVQEVVA